MTAHVAAATEARGRVILRFSAWAPNDVAIQAAMLVANAFQSEVEVLFVEDSQRVDFASFPFAKEYPMRGGAPRAVSAQAVKAELKSAFTNARQRVAAAAAELEVHVYEHVVRDDPMQALVSACARRGPWNMIAIAETFGSPSTFSLDEVFDTVSDATGVIIAGPDARACMTPDRVPTGPVVLAVEDTIHFQGMLRAGRHIAAALASEIVVLLVAGAEQELAQMDAEVRLLLADESNVRLALNGITYGDQSAAAEAVRRQRSAFLIAQYGGVIAPRGGSLRPLTGALPCPILLVR